MSQHAERCPVCEGKTEMPASFYDDLGNDGFVECRSCKGKGYILIGAPDYPVWQPAPSWTWPNEKPWPLVWFSTDTNTTPL